MRPWRRLRPRPHTWRGLHTANIGSPTFRHCAGSKPLPASSVDFAARLRRAGPQFPRSTWVAAWASFLHGPGPADLSRGGRARVLADAVRELRTPRLADPRTCLSNPGVRSRASMVRLYCVGAIIKDVSCWKRGECAGTRRSTGMSDNIRPVSSLRRRSRRPWRMRSRPALASPGALPRGRR